MIDKAREVEKGLNKIGTTGRGIGPAYEDKVARRGIRLAETINEALFADKLKDLLDYHNFWLQQYFKSDAVDFQQVYSARAPQSR